MKQSYLTNKEEQSKNFFDMLTYYFRSMENHYELAKEMYMMAGDVTNYDHHRCEAVVCAGNTELKLGTGVAKAMSEMLTNLGALSEYNDEAKHVIDSFHDSVVIH
jgi:hypothetical protein